MPQDRSIPTSPKSPVFDAIEQQRAHEYVAEQIRRQIGLGIIGAGESLPPERELARMFGVGRVTVQLAIGALEAQKLVVTRRGRAGGSFVLAALEPSAVDMRVVEVASSRDLIEEALDYRAAVEPLVAKAAARLRKTSDIIPLRAIAERMKRAETDQDFMREDTAFHLAIAELSKNRFFVSGVEDTRLQLNAVLSLLPDSRPHHVRSIADHETILEAIAAGDEVQAAASMAVHVDETTASIRTILRSISRERQAPVST